MFRCSNKMANLRNEKHSNMKMSTDVRNSFEVIMYMNAIKDINELVADVKQGLEDGYTYKDLSYDESEKADFQLQIDILELNIAGLNDILKVIKNKMRVLMN